MGLGEGRGVVMGILQVPGAWKGGCWYVVRPGWPNSPLDIALASTALPGQHSQLSFCPASDSTVGPC